MNNADVGGWRQPSHFFPVHYQAPAVSRYRREAKPVGVLLSYGSGVPVTEVVAAAGSS